jgi:butyryl-CoA dehydrogenase
MLKTEKSRAVRERRFSLFTEDQLKWLDKARKFADAIPMADVLKSDSENSFRRDLFNSACKEGLGGLPFPKTYGGSGGDYVSFCLVNEEFGRRCIPIMSSLGVHVLCQEPVYRFGTEEQKQKYLPPSSTGQFLAAFGLTEPNAGSDTAAIETTAREDGGAFILNGTKTFITSGASADYFIVMARLKDDKDSGITAFIVEKNFPGFAIGQKFDMLGMRGYATCEIVFNDCKVPKENMLGERGWGRKVALSSLAKGRVTIAAQATGWAQGSLDAALLVLRKQDNGEKSDVQLQLGEMAVAIESARVLMYQAAYSIDRGESDVVLAGMAKVQATDTAMKVSTDVISLLGAAGIQPELLVERIFRDAKAGQIYEGTNQIQRMLIARSLLK